jgi:succinate dehydrogenase / fumarate reductase cytochrome b subunit
MVPRSSPTSTGAPSCAPAAALKTSIGKKLVLGVTGVLLILFLFFHVAGNLSLFADADGAAFNLYVEKLTSLGPLKTLGELGLLALFGVHIAMALRVTAENREARSSRYEVRNDRGAMTLGSMSMIVTGLITLAFLVLHLIDFRFDGAFEEDPALLVKQTLASPVHALLYLGAVVVVSIHVSHGFQSCLQSLGLSTAKLRTPLTRIGIAFAVLVGLAFAAFPIYYSLFWNGGPS